MMCKNNIGNIDIKKVRGTLESCIDSKVIVDHTIEILNSFIPLTRSEKEKYLCSIIATLVIAIIKQHQRGKYLSKITSDFEYAEDVEELYLSPNNNS